MANLTDTFVPPVWDSTKFGNLTHREHLKLYGSLTPERLEDLLDTYDGSSQAALKDGLHSVICQLDEARAGFPLEDFLVLERELADDLKKNVRGSNKADAERLSQALADLETSSINSVEYGMASLRGAERLLKDLLANL